MAKKEKPTKRGRSWSLMIPSEGVIVPARGMLKSVREQVGLSQPALAKECGVSRDVIANYESGRTRASSEDLLRVWRVLEVKERALNISRKKESPSAAEAVLGLLWFARENARKRLAEIEGQVDNLQRKQESTRHQIAEIEAEETHRKRALKYKKVE